MTLESLMKSELPCEMKITSDCRLYYDEEILSWVVKNKRRIIYCAESLDGAIKSVCQMFSISIDD